MMASVRCTSFDLHRITGAAGLPSVRVACTGPFVTRSDESGIYAVLDEIAMRE
jgi:hypothetical protein